MTNSIGGVLLEQNKFIQPKRKGGKTLLAVNSRQFFTLVPAHSFLRLYLKRSASCRVKPEILSIGLKLSEGAKYEIIALICMWRVGSRNNRTKRLEINGVFLSFTLAYTNALFRNSRGFVVYPRPPAHWTAVQWDRNYQQQHQQWSENRLPRHLRQVRWKRTWACS